MLWIRRLTVLRVAFRSLGNIMPPPQVTEVYSFMPSGEIPYRCFATGILDEVIFYALSDRKPARSAGLFNAEPGSCRTLQATRFASIAGSPHEKPLRPRPSGSPPVSGFRPGRTSNWPTTPLETEPAAGRTSATAFCPGRHHQWANFAEVERFERQNHFVCQPLRHRAFATVHCRHEGFAKRARLIREDSQCTGSFARVTIFRCRRRRVQSLSADDMAKSPARRCLD
jgi:hypothetical protein